MRAAGSNQFSTARRPGRHFCLVISWSIPRGRWDLCRLSRVAYDYFCGRAVCRALPHGRYAGRLAKARRLTAGRVYSVGDFWKRLAEGVSAFGSDSHPDEQTSAKITKRYGKMAMDANPPRP